MPTEPDRKRKTDKCTQPNGSLRYENVRLPFGDWLDGVMMKVNWVAAVAHVCIERVPCGGCSPLESGRAVDGCGQARAEAVSTSQKTKIKRLQMSSKGEADRYVEIQKTFARSGGGGTRQAV